jgi:hypothetical protein
MPQIKTNQLCYRWNVQINYADFADSINPPSIYHIKYLDNLRNRDLWMDGCRFRYVLDR